MSLISEWPDAVDEIVAGDHVVALAHLTPMRGVVLTPVTNFASADRATGTIGLNSSIGAWKKLARLRADAEAAVAFHTRRHSRSRGSGYVLAQGRVRLGPLDDPDAWRAHCGEAWDRFVGHSPAQERQLWRWWLSAYHWRVPIELKVSRLTMWPDLACRGEIETLGEPAAPTPAPQRPPARGVGPRVDTRSAARRLVKLPDVLLGWRGSDGYPMVVPVEVGDPSSEGIELHAAPGLIPTGGRRAGVTGHWFSEGVVGQRQLRLTGWLEAGDEGRLLYAPHTATAYCLPPSALLYRIAAGYVTRRGLRQAIEAGLVSPSGSEAEGPT
jgi:hypothetical protein